MGTHTAHVKVDHPDLLLTKTVSQAEVLPGTPVDYTFVVSNPGDVELEPDPDRAGFVQDDHCSPVYVSGDGGFPELLEPGESWTYECQNVVITSDVRNTATIVANNTEINLTLRRQAFAEVKVRQPGIAVTKHASAGVVHSGDDVTYTYEVTNTGNVPLADVAEDITDDTCSPVTYVSGDKDGNGLLTGEEELFEVGPAETWVFTCTTTVDRTTTNTVTVSGTPVRPDPNGPIPLGPATTGIDTATVNVTDPPTTTTPTDPSTPTTQPTAVGGGNQTPPSSTGGGVLPRTGADLARFSVVTIDAPLILPADNEPEFLRQVAVDGGLEEEGGRCARRHRRRCCRRPAPRPGRPAAHPQRHRGAAARATSATAPPHRRSPPPDRR